MSNNPLNNLSISVKSAINETTNFISYLDKNVFNLILYPNIIEADLASDNYCKLLKSIKSYADNIPFDQDATEIRKRLNGLPNIQEKDFRYYSSSIPAWALYILLPFGIIMWVNYYLKITQLTDKLRDINAQLGTIDFFLKALVS